MAVRRLEVAWVPIVVTVATITGLLLRIIWLNDQPLWYDEQLQVAVASTGDPVALILGVVSHSAAAPLDYVGTWAGLTIFDHARIWPAVVGTATIPALFIAGRRWYGDRIGAIAAVLLAVAPFHVYYSGEARYYALSALVAVIAVWAYRIGVDEGRWWPFALATIACLYSFYFAFLVPVALVALVRRGGLFQLLVAAAAFAPWILLAAPSQLAQGYPQATGLSTVPTPALLAELAVPDVAASGLPWILPALVLAIVIGLLALGTRRAWVMMAIAGAAIAITGLLTWRAGYFWSPRQVLFIVPLLTLAIAAGWARLPRPAAAAVLFVLVAAWLPFIDGVTGADAWQPRTETLSPGS